MKKRTFRLAAAALALALTGCAAADTSTTAAQIEMRVQDGYIQYYNGTDWENLISTEELKGEKGDKGDKGDPGEKGERGETGPQGAKGDKGDPGTNGINGQNGADGINGKDGANGQNGTNGKNGVDGKNGADGKDGVDGKNGINGKDGLNGKDGVDGKDGASTVPGITRELYVSTSDYYSKYGYWSGSLPYGGHVQINNVEKAFIYQQSTYPDDSSKFTRFNILMNEDGRVNITAVPEPGYAFVKWGDGTTSTTREVIYTDDGNGGLSAYFAPIDPKLDWDAIKPGYLASASLTHAYSTAEPWLDISYVSSGPYYQTTQTMLGTGIYTGSGENSILGKYISVEHSSSTTVLYGNLSEYPTYPDEAYIDPGYPRYYSLNSVQQEDGKVSATLRIQILQDGSPVDPETVLPPLSTVDWLEQGA